MYINNMRKNIQKAINQTFCNNTINCNRCFRKCCRTETAINMNELNNMICKENVFIVDVRSVQEYNENHLYRAISIPVYELECNIENIIKDKNSIIILYCKSGGRSQRAMQILKNMGYINLYYLEGGLDEYM